MVKNSNKLEKFYQGLIKSEKISHKKALRIYEMLHREAVFLGAIGSKNILDGLDTDIRIAKTVNAIR